MADEDIKQARDFRKLAFGFGTFFLALGACDGMVDLFPAPSEFFAGTGVSLIVASIPILGRRKGEGAK